ncbi:unnamed protein product [Rangifer tarandus platyrhynchus]|uniref:Uncharacterized protein n=1 Tax=Rangifer tarandus platyrhynchus TaxID=3082113 RepID=A0ABN8XT68_RANTA|nr:unnamed protein product [Rangifer tarandus platyrhynchus]
MAKSTSQRRREKTPVSPIRVARWMGRPHRFSRFDSKGGEAAELGHAQAPRGTCLSQCLPVTLDVRWPGVWSCCPMQVRSVASAITVWQSVFPGEFGGRQAWGEKLHPAPRDIGGPQGAPLSSGSLSKAGEVVVDLSLSDLSSFRKEENIEWSQDAFQLCPERLRFCLHAAGQLHEAKTSSSGKVWKHSLHGDWIYMHFSVSSVERQPPTPAIWNPSGFGINRTAGAPRMDFLPVMGTQHPWVLCSNFAKLTLYLQASLSQHLEGSEPPAERAASHTMETPHPRKEPQEPSCSATSGISSLALRAPQQLIKQGVAMGTDIRQKTTQPKHWAPGPEEAVDECG